MDGGTQFFQWNAHPLFKRMAREGPALRGVNYRKLLEKYGSLISLLLLTPLVFLLLGFIISNSPNYRPSFIQQ